MKATESANRKLLEGRKQAVSVCNIRGLFPSSKASPQAFLANFEVRPFRVEPEPESQNILRRIGSKPGVSGLSTMHRHSRLDLPQEYNAVRKTKRTAVSHEAQKVL
jgi:hypothetical protein